MEATLNGGRCFRGLTTQDRHALYAGACGTGFRASALASLTPEAFDLGSETPVVVLSARKNKSRKQRTQPLPADIAALLRSYLAGSKPNQPVWPGMWFRRAAEMIRA